MAYQILYDGTMKVELKSHRKNKWVFLVLLVATICIRVCYPQIGEQIRSVFLPGFTDDTAQAFSQMIMQIRDGECLKTSVMTFCESVVFGGAA